MKSQGVLAQLRAGNDAGRTVFNVIFLLNVLSNFCTVTSSDKHFILEVVTDNRFSQT